MRLVQAYESRFSKGDGDTIESPLHLLDGRPARFRWAITDVPPEERDRLGNEYNYRVEYTVEGSLSFCSAWIPACWDIPEIMSGVAKCKFPYFVYAFPGAPELRLEVPYVPPRPPEGR